MKYLADIAFLVGAAGVLVGLWWVYPPASVIVGGIALGGAAVASKLPTWRQRK